MTLGQQSYEPMEGLLQPEECCPGRVLCTLVAGWSGPSALGPLSPCLHLGSSHYQLGDFEQITCPSTELSPSGYAVRIKRCQAHRKHVLNGNLCDCPPFLFLESLLVFP